MATFDLYQTVTDRILESLEKGTVPWRQPIRRASGSNAFPTNLASGKPYRGVNVFLLAMTAWAKGYESGYWTTLRQANAMGGQIKRGEKGSLVIFWKRIEQTDAETQETRVVQVIRHYSVFNTEQCQGIEGPNHEETDTKSPPFEPIESAEQIVSNYPRPPTIEHGGGIAVYRPRTDTVVIAKPDRFESPEAYYATLFHELAHSTGHSTRLDRGLNTQHAPFGSADYSKEELIAEMGSAFLAAHAGISPPTIEQSAAYIAGWHRVLKSDKKLLIQAAAAGQQATDHVMNAQFDRSPRAPKRSGNHDHLGGQKNQHRSR